MQLQHAGLDNDAVIQQVFTTPPHKKWVVEGDKRVSPVAEALERAAVEAARKEMKEEQS